MKLSYKMVDISSKLDTNYFLLNYIIIIIFIIIIRKYKVIM
jgi:hypothetical protein